MTDGTGPRADIPSQVDTPIRTVVLSGLRAAGSTAVLVVIYYLLPLDRTSPRIAVTTLAIGLAGLVALVTFQVRWIIRARFPGLRAVVGLATSLPLFVLLFSGAYLAMAAVSPSNFGERLNHTDALYFTVAVLTTVGFGDITAKSEAARLLVTGQMVIDLIILGIGVRIILGAVTLGRQRRPQNQGTGQPDQ